jgi:Protein of unknown function (DUF3300)
MSSDMRKPLPIAVAGIISGSENVARRMPVRETAMSVIALRTLATALFLALPQIASAQAPSAPATAPSAPAAAAVPAQQLLAGPELQALVSPIALYPDALLAEVLMASTYPLEVVEADRWAKANKSLKDEALKSAIDQQKWDDSVKSLAATPEVLDMMSNKLDWTRKLGDAVLAQQPDVMDAIQALRQKAQSNNKLTSTKQQKVSTQQQGSKQVIVIEPTEPNTLYVPYYDPAVVYGSWPYSSYPPYYWPAPPYVGGALLATGLAFGTGYALGRWAGGGNYWGGGIGWGGGNINVNRPVNINNIGSNNNWTHNPSHRQGVRYNNSNVAQKFGGNRAGNIAGGAQNRMDFRGRGGQQVLNPGGSNRPGGGDRAGAGAGNRPGGGDRAGAGGGNRPSGGKGAANRPSGGKGAANRPSKGGGGANRPSGGGGNRVATRPSGGGRGGGLSGGSGRSANFASSRGQMSMGGGGGARGGGGGGARMGGGGGARGGGGGGGRGGGGGGGRRSDARLKHDITYLGRLNDGVGFYRFVYNGGATAYVGVMAEEVQSIMPDAVTRGRDGYFRVSYRKLGLKFQSYDEWVASGARVPAIAQVLH